jgi:transposase
METPQDPEKVTQTHKISHPVTSLTPRQLRAAAMLAEGVALKDIAKELKIRRETVSRWKHKPEFKAEMARVVEENHHAYVTKREEMRHNLSHEMTLLVNEAIGTINSQLNHTYDNLAERAKFAFDVLKFVKADQIWERTDN